MVVNYAWEDVKDYCVGDIFELNGKRHRLNRRGATSAVVQRWWWFDPYLEMFREWWLGRPNDI